MPRLNLAMFLFLALFFLTAFALSHITASEATAQTDECNGAFIRIEGGEPSPCLGVGGTDLTDTIAEFDRIEDSLKDIVNFDSRQFARFYEVDAQVVIMSPVSPMDVFRGLSPSEPFIKHISSILGFQVAPYGLRLGSSDGKPSDEDWHEIQLQPTLRAPDKSFRGILVFRRAERAPVFEVATRVADIFETICKELATT